MYEDLDVTVNETMRDIVQRTDGKQVAILDGNISSTEGDIVTLHVDFDPSSFLEVPKKDIVHATTIDDMHGRKNRLFVKQEAKIVVVRRDTFNAADIFGDGSSGGTTELIDLRKLGLLVAKGLLAVGGLGLCLRSRQLFDKVEAFLEKHGETISKKDRMELEQELLRLDVDMQSCPDWVRPI